MNEKAVPLPVGLREVCLTIEDAEKIRKILDDASHPVYSGKEMPTAETSVLLKKDR